MPTVSYAGDVHDRQLLNLLAIKRNTSIGKLVFEAIDAAYRAELDELEDTFFGSKSAEPHKMTYSGREKKPA